MELTGNQVRTKKPLKTVFMQTAVPWLIWFALFNTLNSVMGIDALQSFLASIATVYMIGFLFQWKRKNS
jgi:hypothetical protein